MIVVDSSVWIDYFRRRSTPETTALNAMFGHERIVIGDLILAEVLQGFAPEADYRHAAHVFEAFEVIEIAGETVARLASEYYRSLRSRGVTVRKTIDTLIAARCIADRLTLLHCDRDFQPFAEHLGLRVYAPGVH